MEVYLLLAILGLSLLWVNREGMETTDSSALNKSQSTAGDIKTLHEQITIVASLKDKVHELDKLIHKTSKEIEMYRRNSTPSDPTKMKMGYPPP